MKIIVTRPFYLMGQLHDIGATADVDVRLARELIHNGKATPLAGAKPPVEQTGSRGRKTAAKVEAEATTPDAD